MMPTSESQSPQKIAQLPVNVSTQGDERRAFSGVSSIRSRGPSRVRIRPRPKGREVARVEPPQFWEASEILTMGTHSFQAGAQRSQLEGVMEGIQSVSSVDSDYPFRRDHRARVSAVAAVVHPGHPGRAEFNVLDLSGNGLFLADCESSLCNGSKVRVGLPSRRTGESVWGWADILWRGNKDGKPGVGAQLAFDSPAQANSWKEAVDEWVEDESMATLASVRRITRRKWRPRSRQS